MSWLVFLILLWASMGLDMGLQNLLRVGDSAITPSFGMVLLVFICLHARPGALMLGSIVIGLSMDVLALTPEVGEGARLVVIGPYALGCMLAAYTILTVRSVMQRKSPFTLAALALLATLLAEVIRLTLLTVRGLYDTLVLDGAASSLGTSLGVAVYTGLLALLLAPLLAGLRRPLRFQGGPGGGFVIHS